MTSPSNSSELISLDGRVAVVTGGARGIGRATGELLARAGADVALVDILDTAGAVASIERLGRKAVGYAADLTDENDVEAVFDHIVGDFGRVDVVHNNAGVARGGRAEDMAFEAWRFVMSIDLDAVFLVARSAARIMIGQGGGGSIINTASMSGLIVNYPQEQAAYNTAKAGVIHLTKSLAAEWAKHGIRVNAVSPGYIGTDMTPGGAPPSMQDIWMDMSPTKRLGTPEEVAGAVLYFASDLSSFTTGANLVVDGGYTCY